jgi:hypothetical protein
VRGADFTPLSGCRACKRRFVVCLLSGFGAVLFSFGGAGGFHRSARDRANRLETQEIPDGSISFFWLWALSGMRMPCGRGMRYGLDHLIGFFCVSVPLLLIAIVTNGGMGGGDISCPRLRADLSAGRISCFRSRWPPS